LIAQVLAQRGCHVDLLAPRHKYETFATLFGRCNNLRNIDFATQTHPDYFRQLRPETVEWYQRLPSLEPYDLVVSDNLPEVLAIRPDAILSGHFFWHDALPDLPNIYREKVDAWLRDYSPWVIATDLFASPLVKAQPRYYPVGVFLHQKPQTSALQGKTLLVSGGSTPALGQRLTEVLLAMTQAKPEGIEYVYVDSRLLHSCGVEENRPPWIQVATYSEVMYNQVAAAICRPGIGTITDLLAHGGRPFCVYEPNNLEVMRNAKTLQTYGVGENCIEPNLSLQQATNYMSSNQARQFHSEALANIDFNGAYQLAEILLSLGQLV
jgi:hypothetical protein